MYGERSTGLVSEAVAYIHSSGILSIERGPGGALYFSDPSGIYKLA